jgi:protein TonB
MADFHAIIWHASMCSGEHSLSSRSIGAANPLFCDSTICWLRNAMFGRCHCRNPNPTNMNNYVLPVCLAAAAHGALLFGFNKHGPAIKPPKPTTIITEVTFAPPEEVPVVVNPEARNSEPKPAIEAPRPPTQPEPRAIDPGITATMPLPPFEPVRPINHDVLSFDPPGGPGGVKEGFGPRRITDGMNLDNPPRTRLQTAPMFPFEAKRNGTPGEVVVEFVVNEQGRVLDPKVVRSSHAMFEEPTLRAVAKWQFEPGRQHGRIVSFRMVVPVVFSLNE